MKLRSLLIQNRAALLVGLVVAAILLVLWAGNFFIRLRLTLDDVYFVPTPVSDTIVIVAIDDASLNSYGRTPAEWSRTVFADVARILGEARARVVAFDVLFAEPSDDDDVFAQAIRDVRQSEARTRFVMPIVGVGQADNPAPGVLRYPQGLRPVTALSEVSDYLGVVSTFLDADGASRRQMTQVQIGDNAHLTFPLASYLAYLRIPQAAASQVITVSEGTVTVANDRHLPVDSLGVWRQNYFGPPFVTFPVVSLRDVVNGEVDTALFNDKIVLIGLMDSIGLTDTYYTPTSRSTPSMAGVEINAHAIETLLQNVPITEQPFWAQGATIALFSLLSSLVCANLRWYWALMVAVGLVILWFVGAFTIFGTQALLLPLMYPALALGLPVIAHMGIQINDEFRRRREAEFLMESVVSVSRQRLALENILASAGQDMQKAAQASTVGIWLVRPHGLESAYSWPGESPSNLHPLVERAGERKERVVEGNCMALPVMWQGRLLAVFAAQSTQNHFSRSALTTLGTLAEQLAPSLENALLYAQVVELSDIKTRMIRMASHDLKNPLSNIIGYGHLVLNHDDNLSASSRKFVENMVRAGGHMNQIITDILNLDQLRSGEIKREPLRMDELLDEVLQHHALDMQSKGQTLSTAIDEAVPQILGDRRKLTQAFTNLIGNAVKYTPNDGSVTVRLSRQGNNAHVEVQDTGYGIPEAAQPKLFQEFYRVQTQATAHISGTGLGLSLVKTVIEAHQGRIWFKSAEGVGSTFFVELPLVEGFEKDN